MTFFVLVTPFGPALASCDTNSFVNGTTAFLRWRQLKWGVTWLFDNCDAIGSVISVMWCQWCHKWHQCILWVQIIKMRCNMSFCSLTPMLMLCNANSVVNSTIAFLRSRQLKRGATRLFGHMIPLVLSLVLHDTNSIINGTIAFLGSRWSKWGATWLSGYVI